MSSNDNKLQDDLAKYVKDFEIKLKGKSREEQEKMIQEERGHLMMIVRTLIKNKVPIVGGILSYAATKIMTVCFVSFKSIKISVVWFRSFRVAFFRRIQSQRSVCCSSFQ